MINYCRMSQIVQDSVAIFTIKFSPVYGNKLEWEKERKGINPEGIHTLRETHRRSRHPEIRATCESGTCESRQFFDQPTEN